jgi:hypothetical protein
MSRPPAREAAHAKGGHGCRDGPAEVASLGRTARTYHPGVPPRVEYEVSELGQPGAAVRGTRRVVGRSGQGRAGPGGLRRHRAGPQSSNLIRKPTRTGGACACPHRMGTGASPSAARSRYVEVAHRSPAPTTAPSPACPPRPLGPVQRSAGTGLDVTPEHASSVSERSTRNDDKRARATACPDEVLIPRILGPDRSLRTKRLDGKPRTADPADLLSDEHPVAQEPDLRTIPTGLPASTGPTDARSNQYSDSISSLRLRPRLAIDTPFVIRCVATSTGTHGSRADQHGASGEASRKNTDRPSVAGTTTRGEQTSISG